MNARARNELEKAQKREHLLDVAGELWLSLGRTNFSMEQLAKQAQVAKGTLYLYFRRKEDVFLALHSRDLKALTEDLCQKAKQTPDFSAEAFVEYVTQQMLINPRLLALASLCHSLIEHTLTEEDQYLFHRQLCALLTPAAQDLSQHFPKITELHLIQVYASCLGLWQLFRPCASQEKLRQQKDCVFAVYPNLELKDLVQLSVSQILSDIR